MMIACSSKNIVIVQEMLDNGIIAMCPYTIGFIDACLLAGDYFLLVGYFGEEVGEKVLNYLEQEERYEECASMKIALEHDYEDYLL